MTQRGPTSQREAARRNFRHRAARKAQRQRAIAAALQRAEWTIALLRLAQAMGQPICFHKPDLLALRKA